MPENKVSWRGLLSACVAWLILVGLYLLMVGQLSASEIVIGLVFASAITLLFLWSRSLGVTRFRLQWHLIAAVRWLPGAILWEWSTTRCVDAGGAPLVSSNGAYVLISTIAFGAE